jgi:hypothetical protein
MSLGLAGLIPFVRTGLVRFISGTTMIFTVGWEAGLMENPIPLAILMISVCYPLEKSLEWHSEVSIYVFNYVIFVESVH